jgi:ABC-type enterobactin transport system permease subunit
MSKINAFLAGPIMFLAYAVYMIARKIMAKRGFTQVS